MYNVLIIDNDKTMMRQITHSLGPQYSAKEVTSLNEGAHALLEFSFDCILIEINLENENGFDLLQKINNYSLNQDTPIIVITHKEGVSDKVHAFSLGAEDYVTKPFEPLELRARVESKIAKRLKKNSSIYLDGLYIQPHFQKVFKGEEQVDLQLTPIEFKVLYALIESRGRPLSREKLVEMVWDKEHSFESRGIDAHVSNLRKKLGSHSKLIGSVYGVGYVYRPLTQNELR